MIATPSVKCSPRAIKPKIMPQNADHNRWTSSPRSKVEDATRHGSQQRLPSDERCRDSVQRCKEAHLQVGGGGEHGEHHHQDPTDHADECSKQKKLDQLTRISCYWHITPPSLTRLLQVSRLTSPCCCVYKAYLFHIQVRRQKKWRETL